jgi:hypothetical protein
MSGGQHHRGGAAVHRNKGPTCLPPITVLAGRESFCAVGRECRSLLILAWSHETCGPTLKDMPSDGCVGRHVPGIAEPSGCPGAVRHVRISAKGRVGIRPTDALGLRVDGDGPTRRQGYGALTAWAGRCGGRRRRRLRRDSDRCCVVGCMAGGGGAQCDQREGRGQHRTGGNSTDPGGGGVGSNLSSPVCVGFSVCQPVCSGDVTYCA